MKNLRNKKCVGLTLVLLLFLALAVSIPRNDAAARGAPAQLQGSGETEIVVQQPELSADGLVLRNAVPIQVISDFPMDLPSGAGVTPETVFAYTAPIKIGSAFSITFVPAGGKDYWGNTCLEYPKDAQDSFLTAAMILAKSIYTSVPVSVRACWITGPDIHTFGYWGGVSMLRDFTGAPRTNTWYPSSLANTLHGSDLLPGEFDLHVSFNSEIEWITGSVNTSSLMLSGFHQLVHALGFFCSADYSAGGLGSYGYGTGLPNIYDTYLEDRIGVLMTDYNNPSLALGDLFTDSNLFFGGVNAVYRNGDGGHVDMDSNSYWAENRNGSHFEIWGVTDSADTVMYYDGVSRIYANLPGSVTMGVLYDLGWRPANPTQVPIPIAPNSVITTAIPSFLWSVSYNDQMYEVRVFKGSSTTPLFTQTIDPSVCKAYTCKMTSQKSLTDASYKWQVRVKIKDVWKPWSVKMPFTVALSGAAWAPDSSKPVQP